MKTTTTFLLLLITIFFFSSCKKNPVVITDMTLTFNMQHKANGQSIEFDTTRYNNAFGNLFSVSTLKYIFSDIVLHTAKGDLFIPMEHYVDARDASTNSFTKNVMLSDIKTITGVSFIFGLTTERNLAGLFPNAPASQMEWPVAMGDGYHYMKFEGKHDSNGVYKNFQCHTGPTMSNPNYVMVDLPNSGFEVAENKSISINMNVEKWFSTPNTLDLNLVTMIMGNQPMQLKLQANGQDVFTVDTIK